MSKKHQHHLPRTEPEEATPLERIADSVERLTIGWSSQVETQAWEPGDRAGKPPIRKGTVTYPGLVTQLYDAMTDATPEAEESHSRPTPGYRPPVSDGPFEALMRIQRFERNNVELTKLVGHAAKSSDVEQRAIALELTSLEWHAEVALGHRFAPRKLPGSCPGCGTTGKLFVNLDLRGAPQDAYCKAAICEATWPKEHLELLGRHLRWEQDEDTG